MDEKAEQAPCGPCAIVARAIVKSQQKCYNQISVFEDPQYFCLYWNESKNTEKIQLYKNTL